MVPLAQGSCQHLVNEPLCRMCKAQGQLVPAVIVDHIVPHKGDESLFWNVENWQSLCRGHHDGASGPKSGAAKQLASASMAGRSIRTTLGTATGGCKTISALLLGPEADFRSHCEQKRHRQVTSVTTMMIYLGKIHPDRSCSPGQVLGRGRRAGQTRSAGAPRSSCSRLRLIDLDGAQWAPQGSPWGRGAGSMMPRARPRSGRAGRRAD